MPGHERYEELCALNVIGQLSTDETQELQEHLRGCSACRNVGDDYGVILDQLPKVMQGRTLSDAGVVSQARREQFIRRAQVSGVSFSSQAVGGERAVRRRILRKRASWYKLSLVAATATIALLVFYFYPERKVHKVAQQSQQMISGIDAERNRPTVSKQAAELPARDQVISARLVEASLSKELRELQGEVNRLKGERQEASAEVEVWHKKFAELSAKSEADSQTLAEAKARIAVLEDGQAGMLAALVEKEDKIRNLSAQMSAQNRRAERERELNAAATDVRQLMAARNLHIIDVADVDKRGKTKKSFGRVFYVEGQSLLFYAFDLDETASPSKVLFQAWGQQEGAGGKPRNLGVFRVDDRAQKRWVLRVDDANLLASIDSLFVTVEQSPGVDQPTGRRLIYAFLGTPANHP
jgi:hypothetical protein